MDVKLWSLLMESDLKGCTSQLHSISDGRIDKLELL